MSDMTEMALRSTSGTAFVDADPGCRIMAVRADKGEVEIEGRDSASGDSRRLRLQPTERDLGWVTPPEGVAWTRYRAAEAGATCSIELAPLEPGR
jgi:hypothetical protein